MARPTQPKEAKPKATEPTEEETTSDKPSLPILNLIIMAVVIVLSTTLSSAAAMYFLAPIVMKPLLTHTASATDAGSGDSSGSADASSGGDQQPTVGPILTLDEFTVNLKDPGTPRYLRATISLSLTPNDPKYDKLEAEALKKWNADFNLEMTSYVPSIRDIIISALTKRTASELSTAMGKQELKDEIKNNVDGLLQGKHQVIRVNLENFIIQ